MRQLEIDARDEELVRMAEALIRRRFSPLRHHVAAALRVAGGDVVMGLHVGSRRVNVCAEQVALGRAFAQGHDRIEACASVILMNADDHPTVTSPCGVCRELLGYHAPSMTVLVDQAGTVRKTYMADLLPAPWVLPGEAHRIPPKEPT